MIRILACLVACCCASYAVDILALAGESRARTDGAKRQAERRAWLTRELVDAYRERGVRSPAWDADLERLLPWAVACLAGDPEPMGRRQVLDEVRRLAGKGIACADPLLHTIGYLALRPETWHWPLGDAQPDANRQTDAAIRAWNAHAVRDGRARYAPLLQWQVRRWWNHSWDGHEQLSVTRPPGNVLNGHRAIAAAIADQLAQDLPPAVEMLVLDEIGRGHGHTADGTGVTADAMAEEAELAGGPQALVRAAAVLAHRVTDACYQLRDDAALPDERARLHERRRAQADEWRARAKPLEGIAVDFFFAPGHDLDPDEAFGATGVLGAAIAASWDDPLVHRRVLALLTWSARHRSGALVPVLSYGSDCAATGRLDTAVPWQLIEAAGFACRAMAAKSRGARMPALGPLIAERQDEIERVLDAYAGRDPARADWCLCAKAVLRHKAGKADAAAELLRGLPPERWARGVEWTFAARLEEVAGQAARPRTKDGAGTERTAPEKQP